MTILSSKWCLAHMCSGRSRFAVQAAVTLLAFAVSLRPHEITLRF